MAIIMGIDPGSRLTGVGVLEVNRDHIRHLHHSTISSLKEVHFNQRIAMIGAALRILLAKYSPQFVVIEQIFLGKNADSAFKLGHARGVCLYEAVQSGAEIREYATRLVKKGVTGHGGADKFQVKLSLERLLGLSIDGCIDSSDALALAYHHAIQIEVERKMNQMGINKEYLRGVRL